MSNNFFIKNKISIQINLFNVNIYNFVKKEKDRLEISRFYGIIIYMFFNDHNPPHFKVKYSEFEANILIESGNLLNGDLPISKLKLVQAWAEIHKDELLKMWDSKEFHKVAPLK